MAKSIVFNIKLNVNGKDIIRKCKTDAQGLGRALGQVKSQPDIVRSSIMKWCSVSKIKRNTYSGIKQIAGDMDTLVVTA